MNDVNNMEVGQKYTHVKPEGPAVETFVVKEKYADYCVLHSICTGVNYRVDANNAGQYKLYKEPGRSEEINALEKIKNILGNLDADGYLNTAFEGVITDAERNIEEDAMYSLQQRLDSAKRRIEELKRDFDKSQHRVEELEKVRTNLLKEVEKLEEWKPYDKGDLPDSKYEYLAKSARELTEAEARKLVSEEFGFDETRVTVLDTTSVLEISRKGVLRCVGAKNRKPLYFSTDWNYVYFKVAGYYYEMVDGELERVEC